MDADYEAEVRKQYPTLALENLSIARGMTQGEYVASLAKQMKDQAVKNYETKKTAEKTGGQPHRPQDKIDRNPPMLGQGSK